MIKFLIISITLLFVFCNPFNVKNSGNFKIIDQSIENDSLIFSSDTIIIVYEYNLGNNYSEGMKAELTVSSLLDSEKIFSFNSTLTELKGKSGRDTVKVLPTDLWMQFEYMGKDNYRAFLFEIRFRYSENKFQKIGDGQIIYFYLKDA